MSSTEFLESSAIVIGQEFEDYYFGDVVVVNGGLRDIEATLNARGHVNIYGHAFATAPEENDSFKISFHTHIDGANIVASSTALDCRTGNRIGIQFRDIQLNRDDFTALSESFYGETCPSEFEPSFPVSAAVAAERLNCFALKNGLRRTDAPTKHFVIVSDVALFKLSLKALEGAQS